MVSCLVKILIQNCFSLDYLKENREWTGNVANALAFPSANDALEFCLKHRPPDVHIVLKFERPEYDINFAVSPTCKDAPVPPV